MDLDQSTSTASQNSNTQEMDIDHKDNNPLEILAPSSVMKDTSSASSAAASAREPHLRQILEAALPTGSVVSNDVLSRLSSALSKIIDESSDAAARKAVAQLSTNPIGRRSPSTIAKSRKNSNTSKAKKPATAQQNVEESEEEEYEVESILSHKTTRGKLLFQIKWKGYPANQSTWEDTEALDGCKGLLKEYAKKHKLSL